MARLGQDVANGFRQIIKVDRVERAIAIESGPEFARGRVEEDKRSLRIHRRLDDGPIESRLAQRQFDPGLAFVMKQGRRGCMQYRMEHKPAHTAREAGIHDVRSFGKIPWAEIVSLRIGVEKPVRFLCVEVREPDTYLSRLPLHERLLTRTNPSFGFAPITISFMGLSPGFDEVWGYIQKIHPEKIAT